MTDYSLPPALAADIEKYTALVARLEKGEIDKKALKPHRVPMGIYEQREDDTYMVRIRLPGGALKVEQFRGIIRIARAYSGRPLHFTTRQDVQLHGVRLAATPAILRGLKELGLSPRGGGGNTVRNIIGSIPPNGAGAAVFDVSPYVRALSGRLIAEPDSWTLPRKFKIAFSDGPSDSALATVNDLGFIARTGESGERGFAVYLGGGMGGNPAIGLKVFDFIRHTEAYNIARAAKNLFDKYGNRRNKHRARLRFLRADKGDGAFLALFNEEYRAVRAINPPPLALGEPEEPGPASLTLPLFLGDITLERAGKLAEILDRCGGVSLRATLTQNLLIRGIPRAEENRLRTEITALFGEPLPAFLAQAVACAGAGTCRLGTCLSRELLSAVRAILTPLLPGLPGTGNLRLKISGCPNSCAQHLIADIGLSGTILRREGRLVPAYQVLLGGLVHEGETGFAEKLCVLPAKAIPRFLAGFLSHVEKSRAQGENFRAYVTRSGIGALRSLAMPFAEIPPPESDPDYYRDWGEDHDFSAAGKSTGECSAGVFDLIEVDLRLAAEKLAAARGEGGTDHAAGLVQAAAAAARSLLVTKGLESSSDLEALMLFKDHFVGKHADPAWNALINDAVLGNPLAAEKVSAFLDEVKGIYASMDDSLRFPAFTDAKQKTGNVRPAERLLDFRGVPCPMNFVKTKLELESLHRGERLTVLLDDGEPIQNVPGSLKEEGHRILSRTMLDGYWEIIVEKDAL